jgi:hypothetical protein
MSASGHRGQRPAASIEELIAAVRRESAAALSTAEAFFPGPPSRQALSVPRRFPGPDGLTGHPERGPRDQATGSQHSGGPT